MNPNIPISLETAFLIEHLDLPAATGMPDATWEVFQLRHLNNQRLMGITKKSRQVGWSWLAAAEGVAAGCIHKRTDSIFTSINQDEAGEKIRYAKTIIEALDRSARPRLLIDNALGLEFDNGSRLISHPCRPIRGKARARVYLDEFAHYAKDREIYQSAVPVISKGGVIRIGSSPLGAGGMFWEIFTESMKRYPGYVRDSIPWWQIHALCRDVRKATLEAPAMLTEERVAAFGTRRLREIYENVPLEDFQQEYETAWVDESVAWIDWELIKRNQATAQDGNLWYRTAKTVEGAMAAIEAVAQAVSDGKIESVFAGGMDIGRKHDTTEITLLGKGTTPQIPFRLGITLDRVEFDDQESVVNRLFDRLPIVAYHIDQNGIGMQLAENAQRRWGPKVNPSEFTNANKELWAVETKLRFQRSEVPIPTERDLVYQIHSIKKKVTAAKNSVFDVAASEKHHADKFWSLALAVWAAKQESSANEWTEAMRKRAQEAQERAGKRRIPR